MFRCNGSRCAKEPDNLFAEQRGLPIKPMGHVFRNKTISSVFRFLFSFKTLNSTCDKCGERSSIPLCPNCHFGLPHNVGIVDNHSIALIGGRSTGKSHYLVSLVEYLDHEIGRYFGVQPQNLGDDMRDRYPENYKTPLFTRKELLQPTQSAMLDSKTKSPLFLRFDFYKPKRLVNFGFFDSAGEDMESLDTMSYEARYICGAAGIIFLLDPLQIDSVRQKLPEDALPPRNLQAEPVYIIERLRELFERQGIVGPTQKIKTPIAFVLSKVDMLLPIIDRSSALQRTGEHFGRFNLADAESVNTEIRNYLDSWTGIGLSNRIEAGFARYQFFGVSSLGRAANKQGRLESISPTRVEDPFLWILYTLGLVKGKR